MFSLLTLAALTTLALAPSTDAQPPGHVYKLGAPSVLGSGCPLGTVWADTATDGQSVSILFSTYGAETTTRANRVRKTCNFVLPVDAVPGVSIGIYKIDFRGYAYVPQVPTAYGKFTNEYFFAGQAGPVVNKKYEAGANEPIFESNEINVQSVIWSPCGGSTNFRMNSAVVAYKPRNAEEDVQIQIDSMDATVSGKVQVYMVYQQCNETSATPPF